MKLKIIPIIFIFICLGILKPAFAGENRVYKIATTAWAGWSALNVAHVKGFWRDEGVNVELVHYYGGPVLIDVIMSEKVDLSVNMVGDVIDMHLNGRDMTILAELDWSNGGDQLILKKGVDLEKQVGNPLGIHYNSPAIWYFMQQYFAERNLDFSQFRLVEMGPDDLLEQFIAGRFFMIQHYSPYAFKAAKLGDGEVVATSEDYPGVIPECLYGKRSHINNIPKTDIKKIIRGIIRGADWLNNPANIQEYKTILNDETFKDHPDYSDEELSEIIRQVKIHTSKQLLEMNKKNGNLSSHLIKLRKFLDDHGRLSRDYTVDDIFDSRLLLEVLREKTKP